MFRRLALGILIAAFSVIGCARNTVNSGYYPKHYPAKKYIRLGVIDTNYDVVGQGPPLLLIHGFGYGYEMFERNLPELAKHYTCYMLDLRGMGYSSKPDGFNYSAATQMQHIFDFMHYFKLEKVSVWGHSMGGMLALGLAIYTPEKIDKLIISDPPVYQRAFPSPILRMVNTAYIGKLAEWFPTRAAARAVLLDTFENDALVTDERVDKVYRVLKMPGAAHALRQYVRSIHFEEAEYLDGLYKDIRAPTLILWGEKDRWFPPALAEHLHADVPQSELHIIPNVGHQSLEEAPEVINPLVVEFLTRKR